MSNIFVKLQEKGSIHPPEWLPCNMQYVTVVGSVLYGCDDAVIVKGRKPDKDIFGVVIPPKNMVFPHLGGHILNFGTPPPGFQDWSKHHISEKDCTYDLTVFGIVKFFELCRTNNPNMIDVLFVPENCILHCTNAGRIIRDNRKLFLSKLCWKKFRGYAMKQLKKMEKAATGKRLDIIQKHGYDVKFAYHVVRLLDEAEQILMETDLDLQRSKEVLKAIRRGEWTIEDIRKWVVEKDRVLESVYSSSKLIEQPSEEVLLNVLLQCLEEHYGSLEKCITQSDWPIDGLKEIDQILGKLRSRMYS